MMGIAKSSLRNLISNYFKWRYPILAIFLGMGVVLLLAGLILFKYQLSSFNRSKLTPAASIEVEENTSVELPATYQVEKGDTLWDLADLFYGDNYLYPQLAKANNLQVNAKLIVGQKLKIPIPAEIVGNHETVVGGNDKARPSINERPTYQVQLGDCLWSIAEKQLGDPTLWLVLYETNQPIVGQNPDLIFPGQILLL